MGECKNERSQSPDLLGTLSVFAANAYLNTVPADSRRKKQIPQDVHRYALICTICIFLRFQREPTGYFLTPTTVKYKQIASSLILAGSVTYPDQDN